MALLAGLPLPLAVYAADPVPLARNDPGNLLNLLDLAVGRRPDEYKPLGIQLGAFNARPSLNLGAGYDDNPLRVETGADGDALFLANPGVRIDSDWGRHFLGFWGNGTFRRYAQASDENTDDFDVGLRGRADLLRSLIANAQLELTQANEDRQDPNFIGTQRSPTSYRDLQGRFEVEYKPADFGVLAGVIYDRFDYDPTPRIGLPDQNNADRNRNMVTAYGRVLYDYSTGYQTYVQVSYNMRDFDQYFDRNGLHRSSDGYIAAAGVRLLFSELLTGDVSVGYLHQDYDQAVSPSLHDISGLDFSALVNWYPSRDWDITLEAGRTIQETILPGASGGDYRYGRLRADYNLLPDLVVSAVTSYGSIEYQGTSPNRSYNFPTVGTGAKYYFNRNLAVGINYEFSGRSVSIPDQDFSDNTISMNISVTD